MATTNDKQKQQHLATLADAFFEQLVMLECEYGAPGLDPKRPFGNSDVERDILVLLDIDPEGDDGDAECFSSRQREYAADLFKVQLIPFLQKAWVKRKDDLQADLVEERNRIASMRTEWADEVEILVGKVNAGSAQTRHAEAEAAKSERRAIEFGDALHRNILAMRAALADCHRHGPSHGMHWIVNTLAGPGQLPDADDVALGGQALFDKEVAEHEAFRSANPGPVALRDLGAAFEAEAGSTGDLSADEAGLSACVTCGVPAGVHAEAPPVDMLAVCKALGFDPTNHHNAAKCPYCRPAPRDTAAMLAEHMREVDRLVALADRCVEDQELTLATEAIRASAKRMLGIL